MRPASNEENKFTSDWGGREEAGFDSWGHGDKAGLVSASGDRRLCGKETMGRSDGTS
jgi:hypothetical protein